MHITELIETLKTARPLNFIWGAGCSGVRRSSILIVSRERQEKLQNYEADPILREVKARFPQRTEGIEDLHSCLLALTGNERKEVLTWHTNWANICMAEMLRSGHAARVLTGNFDGSLVAATATFGMALPLYRRDYPEIVYAAVPSIYLLAKATAETWNNLIASGVDLGPWIVIGCSGKGFGLAQTLLSIPRFEQGLYWIGYWDATPPEELASGFFTTDRNAHWISGFDADSFMAYLLRGLVEFPPPFLIENTPHHGKALAPDVQRAKWLQTFEGQRSEAVYFPKLQSEFLQVRNADAAEVAAVADSVFQSFERAARSGRSTGADHAALWLADNRPPREARPFLIRAVDLLEEVAPGDVTGGYCEVCARLARFSPLDRARKWYSRADDCFALMDFGPHAGAPLPYGHFPNWAQLLAEWSSVETAERSEALFERARLKYLETVEKRAEAASARQAKSRSPLAAMAGLFPQPTLTLQRAAKTVAAGLIDALQQHARRVPPDRAVALLAEARPWLEEYRQDEVEYANNLAKQLFREAEADAGRQKSLVEEAGEQFRHLLRLAPDQGAAVYGNWAASLGQMAMARSGAEALDLYLESDLKFQEAERINAGILALHKNWSGTLLREARERGGPPELWERAAGHAKRADEIEPGQGAYNLACIAADADRRDDVRRWLFHAARFGKMPSVAHVLRDVNFAECRGDSWFLSLLAEIFGWDLP